MLTKPGVDFSKLPDAVRVQELTELRTIHDWVVKPQLRSVPGVAEVNSWGGYEKQFQVRLDPQRLIRHELTFNEVVTALRAVATADAIAGRRVRLPHARDLREFDFGAWDGMRFDDVARRDPALSRAFWEAPGDVAALGGESWNAVSARVGAFVDGLHRRHAGRDIVIVAHIGVIMTQIQIASGVTAPEVLAHRIDNLSVTRLDCADGSWTVAAINHQP